MNQKRISQMLIAAGVIAALGILAWAAFYAPALAHRCLNAFSPAEQNGPEAEKTLSNLIALYWAGLCGVWLTALIFLMALWEYFRVSVRIGQDRSFCPENVRSLLRIAVYLLIDGGLWALAMFVPGMFGLPSGPAWLIFLLVALANCAMGLLAWCLGKLLSRAVLIQQENDLTV